MLVVVKKECGCHGIFCKLGEINESLRLSYKEHKYEATVYVWKREMERRDRDHSDQINNDYKVQSSVLFNGSVLLYKNN